jgi:hypothetical protein
MTATGASQKTSQFSSAATARKTASATSAPIQAALTDRTPVTSSRFAVRGFLASNSRSMMRFTAMAKLRAPTMAMVTSSSCSQCTVLETVNIAVRAAM